MASYVQSWKVRLRRRFVLLQKEIVSILIFILFTFYGWLENYTEIQASTYNLPLPIAQVDEAGLSIHERVIPPIHPTLEDISECAPTDEVPPANAEQYIAKYSDVAIREMKKYGIPASITLAQGLIESAAGSSKLAISANNHFGLKCFSRMCKKGHCLNFTDDTHKDFFMKYRSAEASFRAHSVCLKKSRYRKLYTYGKDYRKWAYGLKKAGYATDKTYAEKLIRIIKRYNLDRYDI